MSTAPTLATAHRWRCFGRQDSAQPPCGAPAGWKAPNPHLSDRICYYCDACKPGGSVALTERDLYQVVRLAVVLTVPAATMDHGTAAAQAAAAVRAALAPLGATIEFGRAWGEIRTLKAGAIAVAGAPAPRAGLPSPVTGPGRPEPA